MYTAHREVESTTAFDGAPAVSVVVPAYKVAAYIGATLRSISAQTFTDYETIVVNDGSPDTAELEAALAPFRDCITYVKQENTGPSGARNTGVSRARGRYVAFLDGDDEWLPLFLEEQIRFLETDPSLRLVYADTEMFGDHPHAGRTSLDSYPSAAEPAFENLLRIECVVQTSGVVAHRETLVAAGLFDPRFSYAEDFDLWLRIAHGHGRIGHNRQVLARHRLHRASLSADETRMYEGRVAVYGKVRETLHLTGEQSGIVEDQIRRCTAQAHTDTAKRMIVAGDYAGARTELRRARELTPTHKLRFALYAARLFPAALRAVYVARGKAAISTNGSDEKKPGADFSEARGNA